MAPHFLILMKLKSIKKEKFYNPVLDSDGKFRATIRFLPTIEGDEFPWISLFYYSFLGPTGILYEENSLTNIKKSDPVSEYNQKLLSTNAKAAKDAVKKQKMKIAYYSNIYVIDDSTNSDNNGKVFILKYGRTVFRKILNVMYPDIEKDIETNIFDLREGCNFNYYIEDKDGSYEYDRSNFGPIEPLEVNVEEIMNNAHSLSSMKAPDQFKSYDVLKSHLDYVLGD